MAEAITNFDLSVLHWIAEHLHCAFLDFLMPILTLFGEGGVFWIALSLILIVIPRTRKMGLCMGISMLLGLIFGNGVLKHAVDRVRPYEIDPALRSSVIFFFPGDSSFPSGHTLASFEAGVSIFLFHKKWGAAALALAFLVAISRLYLTVHFLTDILAGALLGTAFALLTKMALDRVWPKFPDWLRAEKKAGAKETKQ